MKYKIVVKDILKNKDYEAELDASSSMEAFIAAQKRWAAPRWRVLRVVKWIEGRRKKYD